MISVARPLARLAWRDVRRRPLRTALIAVLICIPTVLIIALNVALATDQLDRADAARLEMGRATMAISGPLPAPPASAAMVAIDQGEAVLQRNDVERPLVVAFLAGDVLHPLLTGKYELRSGTAPSAAEQVMVTEAFARRWKIGVGETVTIGAEQEAFTITGIARDNRSFNNESIIFDSEVDVGVRSWFWHYSATFDPAAMTNEFTEFNSITTRDDVWTGQLEPTARALVQLGSIVVLMLLALLISAAFASGARRQLREVGLIAANGGDPVVIRRAFALQGSITAAFGIALGVALAAGAWVLAEEWLRRELWSGRSVDVNALDLAVSFASVIAAGTFAAWLPARAVSRTPVLAALAGRRPLPSPHWSTPTVGLATLGVGVAMFVGGTDRFSDNSDRGTTQLLIGVGCIIVGLAICGPWIVAVIGTTLARSGGVVRLAGRSIARHRARTGPLVAVIAATCAAAILTAVVSNTERAGALDSASHEAGVSLRAPLSADLADHVALIKRVLGPTTRSSTILFPTERLTGYGVFGGYGLSVAEMPELWVQIVDPTVSSMGLSERDIDELNAGRAVATDSVIGQSATLQLPERDSSTIRTSTVPVVRASNSKESLDDTQVPRILYVPIDLLAEFGVTRDDVQQEIYLSAENAVSNGQLRQLRAEGDKLNEAARLDRVLTETDVERLPMMFVQVGAEEDLVNTYLMYGATVIAGLLAMLALGFGVSLNKIEQRDEDRLLQSLGAAPATRRRVTAAEVWVMCATATAIAAPLGIGLAVIVWREVSDSPTTIPWLLVAAFVVGLPLVAAAVFGPLQRSRRRVELLA